MRCGWLGIDVVFVVAVSLLGIAARVANAANPDADRVGIAFTLTDANVIVVDAVLNDTDALKLMLHTAATEVMLTQDAVRRVKSLVFSGSDRVQSWGGSSDSRSSAGNRLRVGGLQRDALVVREDANSGVGTDGKFGLDFFGPGIVEIDFDAQRIAVHETLPAKAAGYERLALEGGPGQWQVQGTCLVAGETHRNRFLIHSGYAGGILLDDAFVSRAGIDGRIAITEESNLTDSFGNVIKVKKGVLPDFMLGASRVSKVSVGFFSGEIGRLRMSVLGADVLRRFNVMFDLHNKRLYVAPRH
jgi:hypothetical protein